LRGLGFFADDEAITGRHVASVGKGCACWVFSGGVSCLLSLYKDEDSAKRGHLLIAYFNHLEREALSRERGSAPLSHSAFKFTVVS